MTLTTPMTLSEPARRPGRLLADRSCDVPTVVDVASVLLHPGVVKESCAVDPTDRLG